MQNDRETKDNTVWRHHQLRFASCLLATCEQLSEMASSNDTSLLVSFVIHLPPHTNLGQLLCCVSGHWPLLSTFPLIPKIYSCRQQLGEFLLPSPFPRVQSLFTSKHF